MMKKTIETKLEGRIVEKKCNGASTVQVRNFKNLFIDIKKKDLLAKNFKTLICYLENLKDLTVTSVKLKIPECIELICMICAFSSLKYDMKKVATKPLKSSSKSKLKQVILILTKRVYISPKFLLEYHYY
jgi:hypothetical protein